MNRLLYGLLFLGLYLRNLLVSNLIIALDVLRPRMRIRPGFFEADIFLESRRGIALCVHSISMTPGTLIVDVSEDYRRMRIHALYVHQEAGLRKEIDQIQHYIQKMFE